MLKNFVLIAGLLFFQVLAANAITPGLTSCGRYQVKGYIRKDPEQTLKFVVNEGTQSQNQFKINSGELGKFAGYIDIYISGEMNVIHIDGTSGVVSEPSEIKPAVPHPLNPAGDPGLVLLKKQACQW